MATCKGKSISVAKFPIGRQSRGRKEAGQLRSNGKFCKASRKVVCKLNKFIEQNSGEDYTILSSKMCTGDVCICPDRDIQLVKQSDDSIKIQGLKKGLSFKTSSL